MKKIGITVLTRNRKKYVIECIKSLLASSVINDCDIYVIDNGSSDGTVETLKEKFGDSIEIISNPIGLGASIGFNMGMRKCMEKGYKYLMTCDDDIELDKNALEVLFNYMEENSDVGICGSKIYRMQKKDTIQMYGVSLDMKKRFTVSDNYRNRKDTKKTKGNSECDVIAACSMMVRASMAEKIGLMPEDTFIYFDDVELCYKAKLANYKVVVCGQSKVWHWAGEEREVKDTATIYYVTRNRLNFFSKYLPEEKFNLFIQDNLKGIYTFLYGCYYKGMHNKIKSIMYAYDDAIHNVMGVAKEGRILPFENNNENKQLKKLLSHAKKINIQLINKNSRSTGVNIARLRAIIIGIKTSAPNVKINISTNACAYDITIEELKEGLNIIKNKFLNDKILKNLNFSKDYESKEFDLDFKMCEHVIKVKDSSLKYIYIDSFCNFIHTQEDYEYFSSFDRNLKLFIDANKSIFLESIIEKNLLKNRETCN